MVIAAAGHTASHSLQAMQRSSPLGYRRSACRPRKRTDCGAFSSGYSSVTLRRHSVLQVTRMPCSSSNSVKVLMKLLTDMSDAPGSNLEIGQQHLDEYPDDGHGNQRLPAQPHDLVVAIAGESRTQPQEQAQEEEGLHQQPVQAIAQQRPKQRDVVGVAAGGQDDRKRRQPSAEEED